MPDERAARSVPMSNAIRRSGLVVGAGTSDADMREAYPRRLAALASAATPWTSTSNAKSSRSSGPGSTMASTIDVRCGKRSFGSEPK